MGLFPKYKKGQLIISRNPITFGDSEPRNECVLYIDRVNLLRTGLNFTWSYSGRFYEVKSVLPLDLVYRTTGTLMESETRSLASRLRNPWEDAPRKYFSIDFGDDRPLATFP